MDPYALGVFAPVQDAIVVINLRRRLYSAFGGVEGGARNESKNVAIPMNSCWRTVEKICCRNTGGAVEVAPVTKRKRERAHWKARLGSPIPGPRWIPPLLTISCLFVLGAGPSNLSSPGGQPSFRSLEASFSLRNPRPRPRPFFFPLFCLFFINLLHVQQRYTT